MVFWKGDRQTCNDGCPGGLHYHAQGFEKGWERASTEETNGPAELDRSWKALKRRRSALRVQNALNFCIGVF